MSPDELADQIDVRKCNQGLSEATLPSVGERTSLARWVKSQIDQAQTRQTYASQTVLEDVGRRFVVTFETLRFSGGDLDRYAVVVWPSASSIPEGSSLVSRQQWHDIKNHLGGLKLYATFLKRKMGETEDRAVVEKLLNGINGLIDHLAQIRGGDPK